eukprot:8484286-Ditylum_brightwellii.AAC.1
MELYYLCHHMHVHNSKTDVLSTEIKLGNFIYILAGHRCLDTPPFGGNNPNMFTWCMDMYYGRLDGSADPVVVVVTITMD